MTNQTTDKDFSTFGFSAAILSAIKQAGYQQPTDVQSKAIPEILAGKDVLAGAETGSGKTAAFALPLLEKLIHQKRDEGHYAAKGNHVRALILVPTRELAIQISDEINTYAAGTSPVIKAQGVFGGVKINLQMMALRGGVDVLVATPGRLLDLVSKNAVKFNKLQTLVVDEVDRLVGEGFKEEIKEIVKLLPSQRQNLMFTATFPESIRYLVRGLLKQPVIIDIDPGEDVLIDQRVYTVNRESKNELLAYFLNEFDWKQVLVFCSAKKSCDNLVKKLEKRGIEAVAMHGDKDQRIRSAALRGFKDGSIRVLIATDVAARGLDIEQLPCVINFELPRSPKDYTHRIGRTGRAGETGTAISFIAHHEYAHFSVIEKHHALRLEREQIAGFEADATAPEPIKKLKKKKPKKLSKKRRQRLAEKKKIQMADTHLAPQKIEIKEFDDDDEEDDDVIETKKAPESKPNPYHQKDRQQARTSSHQGKSAPQDKRKNTASNTEPKKSVNSSIWGK